MSDFSTIRYAVEDGIAIVTLDVPGKLNAFSPLMADELVAALDRIDADDAVKAVIVTGAGGKAFCAGLDLASGTGAFDFSDQGGAVPRDIGGLVTLRMFNCLKPVIGAINGAAVGIGATVQLPMDFRIAADHARFGFLFARRGITPEAASSWFLPRLVGIQTALDWCFSGRLVPAEEALARGLVGEVVPGADLLDAAKARARSYVDNSAPVSLAVTRAMMWRMLGEGHPMAAHRIDSRAVHARGQSDDGNEGVASFFEKRPAVFPDRISANMPAFFPWWEEPDFF